MGPWRLPNVQWETNKTFERSLKDHLTYSLRSSRDQSRSLRDWSRPLREQLRSLRDLWENKILLILYSSPPAISQQFFQWSFMQIMVSPRSSCKSFTGFYRFSLVFQWSLNDLSIIFQWSSPKMWQFLRDCRKIIDRLVRHLSAHWEITERLLKDHWKTIFMKDCRKTILNRFKFFWRPWRPWNSLKDHLGIMKDLGDHWKFTERSLRDLSIFRVFQWSFRGLALCGMGV